jgi:hypothetical protein
MGRKVRVLKKLQLKNISEEMRMKSDGNILSSSMLLTRSRANGKKINAKNMTCWKCGMSGHLKNMMECKL